MIGDSLASARVAVIAAVVAVVAVGGGCFTDIPDLTASGAEAGSSTAGSGATTGGATTSTSGTSGTSAAESSSGGSTTGSAPSSCANLDTLFACYEFETFDGILYDSTPTGLFGVQQAVSAAPGRHGKGARFDGKSGVYVAHDASKFQAMLNAFTIAAWIKPAAGNVDQPRGILDKDGFFTLTVLDAQDGKFEVTCSIGGSVALATVSAAVDTWIHVACVYEKDFGVTVVTNGQVGGSGAASALVGDDSMLIGNDGPQASEATAFLGVIDDVQLWRVALSQQDFCTAADLGC